MIELHNIRSNSCVDALFSGFFAGLVENRQILSVFKFLENAIFFKLRTLGLYTPFSFTLCNQALLTLYKIFDEVRFF